jgi:hypothetical protein
MKNLFKSLAFMGLALAFTLSATAADSVAKAVRIKGSVRYAMKDNVWHPLNEGDLVQPGALIQTATNSQADLVLFNKDAATRHHGFAESTDFGISYPAPLPRAFGESADHKPVVDQDFIRIYQNSAVAIDKLTVTQTGADQIRETQLDVRTGRICGTVKKMGKGSKYEVKIPNGIAGIRGTIYSIGADGPVSVWTGSVTVAFNSSNGIATQPVAAGQQFDVKTGKSTSIPQSVMNDMQEATFDARTGHTPATISITPDVSNHYLSPTEGHNDQGQNNNNQGGNHQ